MGAANFGPHFLERIDLVALPVDETVFIEESQREIANWNDLSEEEQEAIIKEQQETDFKFTVTNIKDFIADRNELLKYCKLLIMDGYHKGIQIGLKIIPDNIIIDFDQDKSDPSQILTQAEIDQEIIEELEVLRQTIEKGEYHGLRPVLVRGNVVPFFYDPKTNEFHQLLTNALQSLANDQFYGWICPNSTIANHSEQVVKQVMADPNKTYQR